MHSLHDEELIKALRCCTSGPSVLDCKNICIFYKGGDMSLCIPEMGSAVADKLEHDRRHIEALIAEIEELRRQSARSNSL